MDHFALLFGLALIVIGLAFYLAGCYCDWRASRQDGSVIKGRIIDIRAEVIDGN